MNMSWSFDERMILKLFGKALQVVVKKTIAACECASVTVTTVCL